MSKDLYKGKTAKQWYDIAVEMASEYSDSQVVTRTTTLKKPVGSAEEGSL
jgi:hypothetical protein